jgi:hypothetical protein
MNKINTGLLVLHVILQLIDLTTTIRGNNTTWATEGNKVIKWMLDKWPWLFNIIKYGSGAALVYFYIGSMGYPWFVWTLILVALNTMYTYVAINNIRIGRGDDVD